jgi:hypothetical protein
MWNMPPSQAEKTKPIHPPGIKANVKTPTAIIGSRTKIGTKTTQNVSP